MTDVFKLALLGHQYGASLLRDAQVALDQGHWGRAGDRIAEFATQLERSLMAEAELMYSNRFYGLRQRAEPVREHISDQQRAIWEQTRRLVDHVEAMHFDECRRMVSELLELLARYWQSEQWFYRSLPPDERLLWHFASRLSAPTQDVRPS